MCWGLLALLQYICPVYCSTSAHFFHDRFYLDEIPVNRHSSSFVSRPLTSRRGNRRDQIGTNIGGCHLLQHLRRKKKGGIGTRNPGRSWVYPEVFDLESSKLIKIGIS